MQALRIPSLHRPALHKPSLHRPSLHKPALHKPSCTRLYIVHRCARTQIMEHGGDNAINFEMDGTASHKPLISSPVGTYNMYEFRSFNYISFDYHHSLSLLLCLNIRTPVCEGKGGTQGARRCGNEMYVRSSHRLPTMTEVCVSAHRATYTCIHALHIT